MAGLGWVLENKDIKQLISKFTGFQEGDENFLLYWNYATSNLIHHQYLDVNVKQVQETITRLCETFKVRGRSKDAERLQELTTRFLSSPTCKNYEKMDTSFSILLFLIRLSRNTRFKEDFLSLPPKNDPATLSEDSASDWRNMLEEENLSLQLSLEEREYFGDEEDADESSIVDVLPEQEVLHPRCDSGIGDTPEQLISPFQVLSARQSPSGEINSHIWLNSEIILPYWCNLYKVADIEPLSEVPSANLRKKWDQYLESQSTFGNSAEKQNMTLSERLLLREFIWMLQGMKSTYVFTWKTNHFEPRTDVSISLSHVTPPMLNSFLKDLCKYGSYVVHLKDFIHMSSHSRFSSLNMHCQTYQVYAEALKEVLQGYIEELLKCEKMLIEQETTFTLQDLLERMNKKFQVLEQLMDIHKEGIQQPSCDDPMWKLALRLLGVLYKHLTFHSVFSFVLQESDKVALPLFLKTCKPYLDAVESLITQGQLEDPFSEFVIQRKESVKLLDEHFWSSALMLHEIPSELSADFFLQPLLPEIVVAGKSVEMLRYLEHNHDKMENEAQDCLYSNFIDNFEKLRCSKHVLNSNECSINKVCLRTNCNEELVSQMLPLLKQNKKEISDSLLVSSFENAVKGLSQEKLPRKIYLKSNLSPCMQSLQLMLQKALNLTIEDRCRKSCKRLMQVLKKDSSLLNHFSVIKNVFLMEAGDSLSEFYSEVFHKLLSEAHCPSEMDLNCLLQSSFTRQHLEENEKLSIILDTNDQTNREKPFYFLEKVHLTYRVPWPVNVIINSQSQKLYSQVFRFLLQLKCAKYALDELRFVDLAKSCHSQSLTYDDIFKNSSEQELPWRQKAHAMQILRFTLLHFIDNFHTYVMTKIILSARDYLQEKITKAEHLDDILQLHLRFQLELQDTCLFQPHLKYIREALHMVLQLAIFLQRCWRDGVHATRTSQLVSIQNKFSQCHRFLTTYLTNPSLKHCNHMEALTFALQAQGSVPCVVWQPT